GLVNSVDLTVILSHWGDRRDPPADDENSVPVVGPAGVRAWCQLPANGGAQDKVAKFSRFQPSTSTQNALITIHVAWQEVPAAYPGVGGWNDYIRVTEPTRPIYQQTSATSDCTVNGNQSASICVHAGELRRFVFRHHRTCGDIRIEDALNAFRWECQDQDGFVTAYSLGLRPGRGLKDLVDLGGWKQNYVRLVSRLHATLVAETARSAWWRNPVRNIPASEPDAVSPVQLGGEVGTIWIAERHSTAPGYRVTADRAAVVTLPGASLGYRSRDPNATPCHDSTVGTNFRCVIFTDEGMGERRHLWIEADIVSSNNDGHAWFALVPTAHASSGSSASIGVFLQNTHLSRIHQLRVVGVSGQDGDSCRGGDGLRLSGSHGNRVTEVELATNSCYGMNLSASNGNYIHRLRVANNGAGVRLWNSRQNRFTHLIVSNHGNILDPQAGVGLRIGGATPAEGGENVVQQATIFSNSGDGIRLESARNYLVAVTTAQNRNGVMVTGAENVIHNLTAHRNLDAGVRFFGGGGRTISHVVSSRNRNMGVSVAATDAAYGVDIFRGLLVLGQNGQNCLGFPEDPRAPIQTGESCLLRDATGIVQLGADTEASFLVPLMEDDSVNSSDLAGGAVVGIAPPDFDWFGFASARRAWGQADPHRAELCGSCRIWDWDLSPLPASPLYRHTARGIAGIQSEFPSLPDQACPPELSSPENVTHHGSVGYLTVAIEVSGDVGISMGNDNGICETSERCIYTPNFGSDQNDGRPNSIEQTCQLEDLPEFRNMRVHGFTWGNQL
ncbi:MAG: right-handed parallel beta-helix repeat-containing protein, partial [Bacteriovoracia bacterium]